MTYTNTTKLGLQKGDSNQPFELPSFNGNLDKIDAAAGAFICTSTTRPSDPYNGQLIYETDTQYLYIRHNTNWVAVGNETAAENADPADSPTTFTNTTSTLFITKQYTVPAKPWPQLVTVHYKAYLSTHPTADQVNLLLRRSVSGTDTDFIITRIHDARSAAGSVPFVIGPNAAVGFRLLGKKVTHSGNSTFTNDANYTNITVVRQRA